MADSISTSKNRLNGICPYFTMFPLEFPHKILQEARRRDEWVLDPFCGRGTTLYASKLLGLPSYGIDSSKVAVAISESKTAIASAKSIVNEAQRLFSEDKVEYDIPQGRFWELAFERNVLKSICKIRQLLLNDCSTDVKKALRGIILGALHGPKNKTVRSYFSNQCQRTYAPKPKYAVNFWEKNKMYPECVDILEIIKRRAERYYGDETSSCRSHVIVGDSRDDIIYSGINAKFRWIITSPPYYGMNTYIPDQWLRLWFLGGEPHVVYSNQNQLSHSSPSSFAGELNKVWNNISKVCRSDAQMVVRFGGINDRKASPLDILFSSLVNSPWRVVNMSSAGTALKGRRQAIHIRPGIKEPKEEFDVRVALH